MLANSFVDRWSLLELQLGLLVPLILSLVVTAVAIDYGYMLYMRSKMPPGPFPLPIVGNTFSLPDNKPWIHFEDLSKRYKAPLITFWIGRLVVLYLKLNRVLYLDGKGHGNEAYP